jgi:hypothetical protein
VPGDSGRGGGGGGGDASLAPDATPPPDAAPDAASGELTDKGYINQALARERRPAEMARLFAEAPDDGVMGF